MTTAERNAEHAYYASKRRIDLLKELSPDGACAECGEVHDHEKLVLDHKHGRMWHVADMSPSQRIARYWKEHAAGVELRAVCAKCSAEQGGMRYHGTRPPPRCHSQRVRRRRRRSPRASA